MKSSVRAGHLLVLASSICLTSTAPAGILGGLFGGKQPKVPTKEERASQDRGAAELFARAEGWQQSGKTEKAREAFHKIVRQYPYAQLAGEAQFREAELLFAGNEVLDAFEAYQHLITNYRGSPRFKRSVEQQYNICVKALTAKTDSFLGISRKAGRDRVIEMFQTVIQNAPASALAANSQYFIARVREDRGEVAEAIAAFQKVVDDYPKSDKAPQAQLRVAELIKRTNKRPESPTNLPQEREAYEDFITNFPEHEGKSEAEAQLSVIDEQEAKKSFAVGQFYERKKNPRAAAIYYNEVLQSSDAALKQEARKRLAAIGQRDPEALKVAKVSGDVAKTPEGERLRNQPNYLGPPAPGSTVAAKKKPKLKTSKPETKPVTEPPLPAPETAAPAAGDSLLNPTPDPDSVDLLPDPTKTESSLFDSFPSPSGAAPEPKPEEKETTPEKPAGSPPPKKEGSGS